MTTPAGWPSIIVEAGFAPTAPGLAGTELILDDVTLGKLDTGTLASGTVWTALGGYMPNGEPVVQDIAITRTSTRQQGPLNTYEAGTCTITLANSDGRFSPENLAGPYVAAGITQVRPMVPVRVRATWNAVSYNLFSGFAQSWTPPTAGYGPDYDVTILQAADAFRVLAGINLPEIAPAGAGELSGTRIGRILGAAGWYAGAQGGTDTDAGQSAMQAATYGSTALALLQVTADSEVADLYIDGAGRVVFRDRHAPFTDTRSATVQAVLGDTAGAFHPAGTELAYVEITRPDDDVTMCNDVQATIDGGTNLQQVTDATSISRFLFTRSYVRSDLILQTDADALQWANYVLTISKNDEARFDQLTLQADADPAGLFPQALGRELGDRIQVWRRPAQNLGIPWSAAAVTSPGTFANLLFLTVPPGTYTVSWTVTLSGTVSAADANNFRIINGVTVIAASVNPGAPGVWPQAPQTFTVTGANPDIQIGTAGSTPTTGAVYGAMLPSPIVKDCFIRAITHTITVDGWQTEWGLQNAARYAFLALDNTVTGQLDFNQLGW